MAYKIHYSDYVTGLGPPDPLRWIGPPGPQGEPGPEGPGKAIIGTTPSVDTFGLLWWDSNSGQLFVQYDDGTSVQWVSANSIDASTLEGSFLPLTGGTVDHANVTTGLFSGIATMDMRQGYSGGVEHRTWVGVSDNGLMSYYDQASLSAFYATLGFPLAAVAAVRTSDQPGAGTANIGFASYAVSDGASGSHGFSWSFYGSNRRMAGAATTIGLELSMGNLAPTVELNPYLTGNTGSTIGLWMSSGSEAYEAGLTVYPGSSAITVVSNGSTWDKGLVFGVNALTPAPVTGNMKAIQLPAKGEIQWKYDATASTRSLFIRSDATGPALGIVADNAALNVKNAAETLNLFQVTTAGDAIANGKATGSGLRVSGTATSAADLVHGLDLYNNAVGLTGYGNAVNMNVPTGGNFQFLINGGAIGFIDATGMNYLAIGAAGPAAGTFTAVNISAAGGGVHLGTVLGSGPTDVTKHLEMYVGAGYGLGVTAGQLNHVVPTSAIHAFYVAAANRLQISGTGLGFNGTAVVAKPTGYGAPTGTATRATFATTSVTLPVLAEHVKALIDDLTSYGLIGA